MSLLRILACGDIHLELKLFNEVLELVKNEKIDLLILPGDFCNARALDSDAKVNDFLLQANPLVKILEKIDIPIFFVLGNHDPVELGPILSNNPFVSNLHGRRIRWNNYVFGGIGGSHMVPPQLLKLTIPFIERGFSQEIYDKGFKLTRKISSDNTSIFLYSNVPKMYQDAFPCDILITHTPPLLLNDKEYNISSSGIYELISRYKPMLCISGHIHNPKKPVRTASWIEEPKQTVKETTLISLGSIDNKTFFLIELNRNNKKIEEIEKISI